MRNQFLMTGVLLLWCASLIAEQQHHAAAVPPTYEVRNLHDRDGIGKFYLGREIAQVMGHEGADWLERPERENEEQPSVLLESLALKGNENVADIGAGSGYLSRRIGRLLNQGGRVYAVDIQPEMLDLIRESAARQKLTNVIPVLGTITNAALATNSIDLVIMVDVYHEFSHPYEMMQSLCAATRPGGRIVFVEYRAEDPAVPIKLLHKMSQEQVRKEMASQPLDWFEALETLPRQHILVFRKREVNKTSP